MSTVESLESGLYRSGSSYLHRIDPRLKLLALPALTFAVFAAATPQRLAGLSAIGLIAIATSGGRWPQLRQTLWTLRWFLLCTLLLHLFFSPGRTLFGMTWLSLDGLLKGVLISIQLSLALLFSSLLAQTTAPAALASGVSSFLAPLRRGRMPVDEFVPTLLMVLYFIPILRQEGAKVLGEVRPLLPGRSLLARGKVLAGAVAPLILSLAGQADALAQATVAETSAVPGPEPLPALFPLSRLNLFFSLGLSAALMSIFKVLP